VINTRGIGPFRGNEATQPDTDDGRGDARDGRDQRPGDDDDDHRDSDTGEDGAPAKGWKGSSFDE
jgi:hypothetical protein